MVLSNHAIKTLKLSLLAIIQLSILAPLGWAQSLGTTNLLEGPAAGSDSVVLAANSAWTATANDSWLHLNAANQSGTVSANVIFTFDANAGARRTGTLTIAGQTLTVTQAGSTYVAVTNATTLGSSGFWPSGLGGVAVDGSGNVYIADTLHSAIKEWVAASNTVATLVSSGLRLPYGVSVDSSGNVYIADTGNNAIKEWIAASNTVTTLVSLGLSGPTGVAVDGSGNVYIADSGNSAIKEWLAASNTVSTLVSSGLSWPQGVAVDGSGNVFIADTVNSAIKEWLAAGNMVIKLVVSSGLNQPSGVAVDGSGNVYFADNFTSSAIHELPRGFVDTTVKVEPAAAGSDVLAVVLPATANLTRPFAPVSNSGMVIINGVVVRNPSWLFITGVTNGVVSFAFTANPSAISSTASITVLGMAIPVIQSAAPVTPPSLTGFTILTNGAARFGFINYQGASFTVGATTNLSLPLTNWTLLGPPVYSVPGRYQFTDPAATNDFQRFYRVSSP